MLPVQKLYLSGCFDCIHVGHVRLLLFARQLAGPSGIVHVSLDSDDKIKRDKGEDRPIFSWDERFIQVMSLGLVNMIHKHDTNEDLRSNIWGVRPDYIIVGESYRDKPVVGEECATVVYHKMIKGISSTEIIERIRK